MSGLSDLLETLREEADEEARQLLDEARSRATEHLRATEVELAAEAEERRRELEERMAAETAELIERRRRELQRELLDRRHDAVEAVLEAAGRRLATTTPSARLLAVLVREALADLPSGAAVLRCSPSAGPLIPEAAERRPEVEIDLEIDVGVPGAVATTGDGTLIVEATLPALFDGRRDEYAILALAAIEEDEEIDDESVLG